MRVELLTKPALSAAVAKNSATHQDKRAPMASAAFVYNEDNSVAWDQMWGNFCVLASAGGPPHRATLLQAQTDGDPNSAGYQFAVDEIVRGIALVSGLRATATATGWIAVECGQAGKAALVERADLPGERGSLRRWQPMLCPSR